MTTKRHNIGGNHHADDHRDEWHSESDRKCDADCEHDATATELHSDDESELADGGGREYNDLHDRYWGVERLRWSSNAECERTADGSDSDLLAGDGNGIGKLNADGNHRAEQHR